MKKFLLTLGVASMALSSFAATRILYQQNFETAASVEETGWKAATPADVAISIASDSFGKYLEISLGQHNGRSASVTWGQSIFLNDAEESVLEDGTYNITYDFSIKQGSTNQYNGCLTVFTNHAAVANQPYRNPWSPAGYWQNYLFDMSQVADMSTQYAINGGTIETETDGVKSYAIDYSEAKTFDAGQWYTVSLDVNIDSREVDYSVTTLDGDPIQTGTLDVPETDVNGDPISMYAEGLYIMLARYQTIINIDNIKISYESNMDYANDPTIALTRLGQTADEELDLNMRAYTITFLEGETLHVEGTDGKTIEVEYDDCEEPGSYVYETTTSGTLTAWTTSGTAESEKVSVEVDCAPVVLPGVTATISSVEAGFGKTYTLTISNADVPLRPTIFIDYEFTGVNGEKVSASGEASGCKVTVTEEGVLKVTSAAFGYKSMTVEVKNDNAFEVKKTYDFARMDEDELKEAGFATLTVLNSGETSGFNNWTARKRLYYNLEGSETENDNGETVWTAVYPFGFISEDNTTNVIKYCVVDRSAIAETVDGDFFEGLTIFPERGKVAEGGLPNVGILYRIGLYNDQTTNNNNNIYVNDLDENDFVVVNYINNYGGNSCHPVCATDDQYYAQLEGENAVYSVAEEGTLNEETNLYSVVYPLYRVDTACNKITVFKPAGSQSGVVGVETVVEGDNWYYSVDGIRMAEPTRPGIYIHNGKKVIVK